jgi:single-strand DNA-binding protein
MFDANILGRLGKDPEMRYTPNGTAVLNFSIAHNWEYRGQNKFKWVKCTVWGDLAEEVNNEGFTKGQLVRVKGSITFRTWQRDDRTEAEEVELRVMSIERTELIDTPLPVADSE